MGIRKLRKSDRINLIGREFPTISYGDIKIIRYFNSYHIMVEFLNTGTYCSTTLDYVRRGLVKDMFAERRIKLIYGVGFPGYGKYSQSTHTDAYYVWISMLKRCYNPEYHKKQLSYKDCYVCEEWHNFQNFAAWYYIQQKEHGYQLDKDILVKNNKEYGPSTCAFVPQIINSLFSKTKSKRGKYPIGVYYAEKCTLNPFISRCGDGTGKYKLLGCYPSPEEAFLVYKKHKEKRIRQMANDYRSRISPKVYQAMMEYQVEITD